jgi:short-subunit dehydrogenase
MARRPPLAGNRVLITGASSGIGAQLAQQLAAASARVLLVARREDRLRAIQEELATVVVGQASSLSGLSGTGTKRQRQAGSLSYDGAHISILAGDITSPEFRQEIDAWVAGNWQGLDVLINNAGIGSVKPFVESDEECLRELFEVNFFAPVELIRTLLPRMKGQTAPAIVNIGSVLGHFAAANKSEYCASKFAVHGFSDAIHSELHALGIHVLLVSPSTTRTEFFDQQRTSAANSPFRLGAMTPERVAQKSIRALQAGRREIILSAGGRLSVWLDRVAPWLMARIQRRSDG